MKLIGIQPISIIQGDTRPYKIKFDRGLDDLIDHIFFTSKDLNIEEKMEYLEDEKCWQYYFDSATTSIDPSDYYSFDITVIFKDGDVLSSTKNPLKIIRKENPVESDNPIGE